MGNTKTDNKELEFHANEFVTLHRDKIDDIMDNFNFAKVKKVMDCLNWKMYNLKEDTCIVPDEGTLRSDARKMLLSATKDVYIENTKTGNAGNWFIATGAFRAEAYYDPSDKFFKISLFAVIEEWDADNESEIINNID